jgi:hypothetical protein
MQANHYKRIQPMKSCPFVVGVFASTLIAASGQDAVLSPEQTAGVVTTNPLFRAVTVTPAPLAAQAQAITNTAGISQNITQSAAPQNGLAFPAPLQRTSQPLPIELARNTAPPRRGD